MEKDYIERPIDIMLDVPYYMPLKMYNEFRKRVMQKKKFVVTAIDNARERGEGIVLDIKLVLEW